MFLLQAAIAGGFVLLTIIGVALLIGIPVLTIIIAAFFTSKDSSPANSPSPAAASTKNPAPKSHFLKSFVIATAIVIIALILIFTFALPYSFE
jgi:H+/gluconate symporter-like permease